MNTTRDYAAEAMEVLSETYSAEYMAVLNKARSSDVHPSPAVDNNATLRAEAFQALLRYFENRFRRIGWAAQSDLANRVVNAYLSGVAVYSSRTPETMRDEMHGIIVAMDYASGCQLIKL